MLSQTVYRHLSHFTPITARSGIVGRSNLRTLFYGHATVEGTAANVKDHHFTTDLVTGWKVSRVGLGSEFNGVRPASRDIAHTLCAMHNHSNIIVIDGDRIVNNHDQDHIERQTLRQRFSQRGDRDGTVVLLNLLVDPAVFSVNPDRSVHLDSIRARVYAFLSTFGFQRVDGLILRLPIGPSNLSSLAFSGGILDEGLLDLQKVGEILVGEGMTQYYGFASSAFSKSASARKELLEHLRTTLAQTAEQGYAQSARTSSLASDPFLGNNADIDLSAPEFRVESALEADARLPPLRDSHHCLLAAYPMTFLDAPENLGSSNTVSELHELGFSTFAFNVLDVQASPPMHYRLTGPCDRLSAAWLAARRPQHFPVLWTSNFNEAARTAEGLEQAWTTSICASVDRYYSINEAASKEAEQSGRKGGQPEYYGLNSSSMNDLGVPPRPSKEEASVLQDLCRNFTSLVSEAHMQSVLSQLVVPATEAVARRARGIPEAKDWLILYRRASRELTRLASSWRAGEQATLAAKIAELVLSSAARVAGTPSPLSPLLHDFKEKEILDMDEATALRRPKSKDHLSPFEFPLEEAEDTPQYDLQDTLPLRDLPNVAVPLVWSHSVLADVAFTVDSLVLSRLGYSAVDLEKTDIYSLPEDKLKELLLDIAKPTKDIINAHNRHQMGLD